ncbi:MAG: DNA repair protein RecO [Thermodesulfobacteriota bacterium]|nr:DNA repair protein RecO [Thermodesulfobacteriota bacterium]
MPLYRTEAIVIRSTDFSDFDKIVTFFTRDYGKLKGIAKGAKRSKKRFSNTLELFSYVHLFFFEKENKGLSRINNCSLIETHVEICKDIQKMAYGSYFIELIDEFIGEREKNEAVFSLLVDSLSLMNSKKIDKEIARIFEIRLLSLVGYQPQLEGCVDCGRKLSPEERFWFGPRRGGILCDGCSHGHERLSPMSLGTLRMLVSARDMDFKKIHRLVFSKQALKESEEALTHFIFFQMGKEPNSMKFLKTLVQSN